MLCQLALQLCAPLGATAPWTHGRHLPFLSAETPRCSQGLQWVRGAQTKGRMQGCLCWRRPQPHLQGLASFESGDRGAGLLATAAAVVAGGAAEAGRRRDGDGAQVGAPQQGAHALLVVPLHQVRQVPEVPHLRVREPSLQTCRRSSGFQRCMDTSPGTGPAQLNCPYSIDDRVIRRYHASSQIDCCGSHDWAPAHNVNPAVMEQACWPAHLGHRTTK